MQAEVGTQPYIRVHGQNTNEYLSPYKMANDDPEKFYISGNDKNRMAKAET